MDHIVIVETKENPRGSQYTITIRGSDGRTLVDWIPIRKDVADKIRGNHSEANYTLYAKWYGTSDGIVVRNGSEFVTAFPISRKKAMVLREHYFPTE